LLGSDRRGGAGAQALACLRKKKAKPRIEISRALTFEDMLDGQPVQDLRDLEPQSSYFALYHPFS